MKKKINDTKINYDIYKFEDIYNSLRHVKLDAYRMLHKPEVIDDYKYYKDQLTKINISTNHKKIDFFKRKIEKICSEIDYLLS